MKVCNPLLCNLGEKVLIFIGGAPVKTWVFRACSIQGTQQIYVVALWYWGDTLTRYTTTGGSTGNLITSTPKITAIMIPIAILLWVVGALLLYGLPTYYRQEPGKVPSFYTALLHRKIVIVSRPFLLPDPSLHVYVLTPVVVFRHGHHSELLDVGTLRPQLAVSLLQRPRANLVHIRGHRNLLRSHLGRASLGPLSSNKKALVGSPHLRHRSRSAPLVPNALGHVQHWALHSLGRPNDRCSTWTCTMVMVRCS